MNREVHVRFFEGLRVQLPWATHLRETSICCGGPVDGAKLMTKSCQD